MNRKDASIKQPLTRGKPPLATLLLALLLTSVVGCETIHFYSQAAHGQLSLLAKREPIEALLADPDTEAKLKHKLQVVQSALSFAGSDLDLPTEDQYDTYVALDRQYPLWNVVAADPLSLKAHHWCYPLIGCQTYRGYFSEDNARKKAAEMAEQGYDVYVRGVSAYSTIGWFDDPILSSFIHYNDHSLRALIFHELAHQVLYFEGDSMFNESFAMAVEMEGIRLWYEKQTDKQGYEDYLAQQQRRQDFLDLVLPTREALRDLYQTELNDEEKLAKKAELIQQLRTNYEHVKDEKWGGKTYYKRWFSGPLNNAQLNSVATYFELAPGLRQILRDTIAQGGSFTDYYELCKSYQAQSKSERHSFIKSQVFVQ